MPKRLTTKEITRLALLLCNLLPIARCLSNAILQRNTPVPIRPDVHRICRIYPHLSASQYSLCMKYPDVMAVGVQGLQVAVNECQFQFKGHRWNCSAIHTQSLSPPGTSKLLSKGYRETAFAYAISAAGMSAQISRACAMGQLPTCGCKTHKGTSKRLWKWEGCEHNVKFGDFFTRKFWDLKRRSMDMHSQMNLHNNRAGRTIWKDSVRMQCKCHGMSGSCEMKTCWKMVDSFRSIGSIVKEKFNHATKVDTDNSSKRRRRLKAVKGKKKHIKNADLIYFENSPNFCEPDWRLGSKGTGGRVCNASTTGIDNCDTLCCGRGYNTIKVSKIERCHCKFLWCCEVRCKSCLKTSWITVCK